jgi:hypothetical protein
MKALTVIALLATVLSAAAAAEKAISIKQSAQVIDAVLQADWKAHKLKGNAPASDEVFVRRIFLDLAGRIPTSAEATAFLQDKRPEKRASLIKDLLARESYVSTFYNFWADILRYKSRTNNTASVVEAAYGKFIKDSLRSNKRYDEFTRELLSARGFAWDNGAIGYYLRDPGMPLENMAITARVFIGTRIECAQCHNHPFEDWKQTQFYSLAAFTHSYADPSSVLRNFRGEMTRRSDEIEKQFQAEKKASSDKGAEALEQKNARIAALDNRGLSNVVKNCVGQLFSPIELARDAKKLLRLPKDFKEEDGKPGDVMKPATIMGESAEVAPGEDSAAVFARWLASPNNPPFTRVVVNRLWGKLFGAPVIDGFDDLKEDSVPMVPELERALETLMVDSGYDLKTFIAVLVNTKAYQSAVSREEFVRGKVTHFQGPFLRRMSAEQIWDSLVALASHEPDAINQKKAELEERRINISKMAADAYMAFDGQEMVTIAQKRLAEDAELTRRALEIKTAMVEAKAAKNEALVKELSQEEGKIARESGQRSVDQLILPMLNNLARVKGATLGVDSEYKPSGNPRLVQPEAWGGFHLAGYGPPPKSKAEVEAAAEAEKSAAIAMAERLGIPENAREAFTKSLSKSRADWVRASELESPAPRGHFLRLMGQSDREFVENASTAAAIPQALVLMNSELISTKGLLAPYTPLMLSINASTTAEGQVDAAYLALFARKPTPAERAIWSQAADKGLRSIDDLLYALLNTKQFIFIQ